MTNSLHLKETDSTNNTLNELSCREKLPEGYIVYTDYQTSGKGQTGNSWHSEWGENALFSLLLYPRHIHLAEHFILSQLIGIAVKKALDQYTADITIKWPNDIYWKDRKIAGILIENTVKGATLDKAVIGIGININQEKFPDTLPNPVSLYEITGVKINMEDIIHSVRHNILDLYCHWDQEQIRLNYRQMLYRGENSHMFESEGEKFEARIIEVQADGRLDLQDTTGKTRCFYMKEVRFIP